MDHEGVSYPYSRELSVALWAGNELTGGQRVKEFTQFLDSSLFQYNMRGWTGMQNHIHTHAETFKFYKMKTSSGHRGFLMICKNCTRVCKISWSNQTDWNDEELETKRVKLRDFLGFGTRSAVKRQRIV